MRSKYWIIDAVNEWLGVPGDREKQRNVEAMRHKYIWTGLILEFVPDIRHTELARIAKIKSHTPITAWYNGWKALPVQVRHSWIEFFMGSGHKRAMMLMLARDPLFQSLATPSQTDTDRKTQR